MINFEIDHTVKMLDCAVSEYKPSSVYVAYSGGKDSAVVLDIMSRYAKAEGIDVKVMAIETGLQFDGWREMITRHVVDGYGMELEIVTGDGFAWYEKNVETYGFGYTPQSHVIYYRHLKQNAIQSHLKAVKAHHHDRVIYVTGVRRAESVKRQGTKDVIRHGSRVTVNAIAHWSDFAVRKYHAVLIPDYKNIAYDLFGSSGDCFCGWTCNNKVRDFESVSPVLFEKLKKLDRRQVDVLGMHGYGTRGDVETHASNEMPDDSLCVNCTQLKLL